jgi:hypothetical protein
MQGKLKNVEVPRILNPHGAGRRRTHAEPGAIVTGAKRDVDVVRHARSRPWPVRLRERTRRVGALINSAQCQTAERSPSDQLAVPSSSCAVPLVRGRITRR